MKCAKKPELTRELSASLPYYKLELPDFSHSSGKFRSSQRPPIPDPEPVPGPVNDLPDPNDPNSPSEVVILENGSPRIYIKVWDESQRKWVYSASPGDENGTTEIPDEDVPLTETPKCPHKTSAKNQTLVNGAYSSRKPVKAPDKSTALLSIAMDGSLVVTIPDEEAPLAAIPNTGDTFVMWGLLALVSGSG